MQRTGYSISKNNYSLPLQPTWPSPRRGSARRTLESKFSPYHNLSFGEDCGNKPRIKNVYNYNCEKNGKFKEISWLLNSGCTDYVVNDERKYEKFILLKNLIEVKLPDGKILKATKVNNIKTYFKNYYNEKLIDLKNVYFVKGINKSLLSVAKITRNNTIVYRNDNAKIYNKNKELVAEANKINDLYVIQSNTYKDFENNVNDVYVNSVKLSEKEKWHRALGHVNFQYLNKLVKDKLVEGLPDKLENNVMKCANCIQSKMANVPFENERSKTSEILVNSH